MNLFRLHGIEGMSEKTGVGARQIARRRRRIESHYGIQLLAPSVAQRVTVANHPQRVSLTVTNGIVLVGSDGHYWPGPASTAHRAFVQFCKDLKPVAVIMNGDAFDGATISRHPPIGWETNPTVKQELEAAQERLGEIELAAFKARKIWPLGNHDARFETKIATVGPELKGVYGVHLKDHFPNWEGCWSCWINDDVVVKHRYKGGVHATHNNTLNAGKTMVTGHLHSLKVTPLDDYNGTRWGVDTGCLADPGGPQFVDYSEDNPRNHRSGFVVLTFVNGRLMWPELVYVIDKDHVGFRGEIIKCAPSDASISKSKPRATARRRAHARSRANPTRKVSSPASAKTSTRKR